MKTKREERIRAAANFRSGAGEFCVPLEGICADGFFPFSPKKIRELELEPADWVRRSLTDHLLFLYQLPHLLSRLHQL